MKPQINKYFHKTFEDIEDSVAAKLKIECYPPKIQNYIREMVGTIEALYGPGSIKTVILFGSLSYGKITSVSDVDIVIVVKDEVNKKQIRESEPILNGIEIKYKYSSIRHGMISKIMAVIEKNTGMFVSHFVCREEAWKAGNFSKIFSTNPIVTWILAPDKLVLDSMKSGAKLLYGKGELQDFNKVYHPLQLIKSLFMDLIISFGVWVILPFSKKNMKYVLESFKWGLRAGFFYLFQKTAPLNEIIAFYDHFTKTNFDKKFYRKFITLRENLQLDWPFALTIPMQIYRIHRITFAIKRRFKF